MPKRKIKIYTMSNQDNKQSILSVAGENYEYLKTIVNNKIEIKKLELLDAGSSILRSLILFTLMGTVCFLLSQVLLALAAYALYLWLGSWIQALSILSLILVMFLALIYLFRGLLIYRSVNKRIPNLLDVNSATIKN